MDPIKSPGLSTIAMLMQDVTAPRPLAPLVTDRYRLEVKPFERQDTFTRGTDVDPLQRLIERLRAAAATQPVSNAAVEKVDSDAITAATETRVSALAAEYIAPYWAQASIGWAAPVSAAAAAAEATQAATVVPAHTATTTTATTTPATTTTPAVTTTTTTATTAPATVTPSTSEPAATTTTSTATTATPTSPTPETTSTQPSRQGSVAAWLHGLFGR